MPPERATSGADPWARDEPRDGGDGVRAVVVGHGGIERQGPDAAPDVPRHGAVAGGEAAGVAIERLEVQGATRPGSPRARRDHRATAHSTARSGRGDGRRAGPRGPSGPTN